MNSQMKSKYDMRKLNAKFLLLILVFWTGWLGAVNAALPPYSISIDKIGSGQGTVSSTNDGDTLLSQNINCGTTCAGSFPPVTFSGVTRNVNVSFTAIPAAGSVFKGWFEKDGVTPLPDCGTRISCPAEAIQAGKQITAQFDLGTTPTSPVPFTVINAGSGSDYGRVLASPTSPGIDCKGVKFDATGNTDCAESYTPGKSVSLKAEANQKDGAFFGGWEVYFDGNNLGFGRQTNLCLGLEPTCNITVPPTVKDVQVRAIFNLGYILTLQRQGEGAGSLLTSSNNLQQSCLDSTCTQTFDANREVEITAVTSANSQILGWTVDGKLVKDVAAGVILGGCNDKSLTCKVKMDGSHLVMAKFDKVLTGTFTATLLKEGSGTGFGGVIGNVLPKTSQESLVKKIDCGTLCSNSVNKSDAIRFEAKSDGTPGVIFAGWKVRFWDPIDLKWVSYPDMCTGLQPICEVTITQDVQVMARFDYDITLTIVRDGTGVGSVLSNSPALNKCTVDSTKNICEQSFVKDQEVSLTAVTDAKSRFGGWAGECKLQPDDPKKCTVTMDKRKEVTATFNDINNAKLTIKNDTKEGGTVKSDIGGGDCGGTKSKCAPLYPLGSVVMLTAAPLPGWEFDGWDSDVCNGLAPTCKVTMKEDITITAVFRQGFRLSVDKQGEGDGTVLSEPSGINCGTTCAYSFDKDTKVTLTAKPVNGSTFLGWGGACGGAQLTCTVSMSQAQTVAITFSGVGFAKAVDNTVLTWNSTGDAPWSGQLEKDAKVKGIKYVNGSAGVSGLITHNQNSSVQTNVNGPANLSFAWKVSSEADRDELHFEIDGKEVQKISGEVDWTQVKLSLSAGKHLLRWTYIKDADLSSGADMAWLDQVQVSTPEGSVNPNTLTILTNGSGSVVSNPSGISCGGACSADFNLNTAVMLTANPQGNNKFAGWSGACTGNGPTCLVTMNGAQSVGALFNATGTNTGNNPILNKAVLNLGLLNDTGIDWCANKSSAYMSNKEANCEALMAAFPGQDGQVGRDAANRKGQLVKIGSGDVGFDFTKICNNGQAEGEANCPANQSAPATGPTQWGCTRDNVTGLVWEIKTVGGLRDKDKVYSWYNANDRVNGGHKGDNCTGAECNTAAYTQLVNQQGLCGANNWRLPTRHELHSIVHHGRTSPAVDIANFPNTVLDSYWTATPAAALPMKAWLVNFDAGWDFWDDKANRQHVRLVRQCDSCDLATTSVNPNYSNSVLSLPQVKVESDFYDAKLKVVAGTPLTFELTNAQPKKAAVGRSSSVDQVRYYLNGLLVVNNVIVGAEVYNASLQLVPGSNPLQFKLLGATLVQ